MTIGSGIVSALAVDRGILPLLKQGRKQMHSAIVYAVMPTSHYELKEKTSYLLAGISKIEHNKSVRQLGDFVWQVNFQESPDAFAVLIGACEQLAIPYRILQLDAEPQWIRCDPKPT
jgi:hypothetical protein